jgi:3-isopropylmalate/(R)-2-methylmalate dehydratase small subunit
MEPIRIVESRTVVLPEPNIDTDQICPARFLKVTDKKGLSAALFADWRFDSSGAPKAEFILNKPEAAGAQILVAGDNFGCGSSREHAPWALIQGGFRAVISTTIADIFKGNSLKNGFLPVVVEPAVHQKFLAAPGATVKIDLEAETITVPGGSPVQFKIDAFSRYCLLNGVDELGFLLSQGDAIAAFERAR